MTKTIEEIRRNFDLLALAERDTRLKRTGAGWWAGACPFCGGRDRFVLHQTADGWRWFCRHCANARYLDALDYVQRREGLDFKAAARKLDADFSPLRQPQPTEKPPQDADTIKRLARLAAAASKAIDDDSPLAAEVRAYLWRRGFIEPTWQRALLGAAEAFDPQAKRQRPALAIPYFDSRTLDTHAIKYRFVDDEPAGLRYIGAKGSQTALYWLPEHLGHFDRLLVLEGELNALSCAQVLPELDLISTGSQNVSERQKADLAALSKRYKRVFVWMDEPQKAQELARLVGGVPIQSPQVDGTKYDANELLKRDWLHEFTERLTGARCNGWTLAGWRAAQSTLEQAF